MAEASKKMENITKIETVQTGVTLTLTMEEAQTLQDVVGRVGGHPQYSRRTHTDAIADALISAGVCRHFDVADFSTSVPNVIYFTPTK